MGPRHVNAAAPAGPRGFGLIEQIITLVVLAVLLAMAVPAYRRLMTGHELRRAQSDYIAALQHARNLALNEQARIIVCPSHDGLTCNGDNNWQDGWLVGRDPEGKAQPERGPLYTGGRYSGAIRILGSSKKHFSFKPDGSATDSIQRLVFCTRENPPRVRVVRVAMQGRIRASEPDADDMARCMDDSSAK